MKQFYMALLSIALFVAQFAYAATPPDCTLIEIASATATSGNAALAIDGNTGTRWESAFSDQQSITLDLGTVSNVSAVSIDWETASAKDYYLRGSVDGVNWTDIAYQQNMAYGARIDVVEDINAEYRYIKMDGITRTTVYGYSIWEFNVCSTPIEPFTGKHALFIGNSYTYYNDMPDMVADIAASMGDALMADSNTIGGFSLEEHSQNATTLNKIQQGNWDYVVLQDQSQRPALQDSYVAQHVYPFAEQLADMARQYSPCAEIYFYRTWGRENGDDGNCGGWPAVCTYEGMDNLLAERYQQMADDNDAMVSPVGAVWRQIRTQHPEIDLYIEDESHPTLAGSYTSAVTFYTVIFRKDPTLIPFNSTLSATVANQIKALVKSVVFDDLPEWNVGDYDPVANFTFSSDENTVSFTDASVNAVTYSWDFGDGTTSEEQNPVHTYPGSGPYTITLTAVKCGRESTTTQEVENLATTRFSRQQLLAYPNPATDRLYVPLITNGEIHVTDMAGKTTIITVKQNVADISGLAAGSYCVKATAGGQNLKQTIIIK